jgi:hypothetical protein
MNHTDRTRNMSTCFYIIICISFHVLHNYSYLFIKLLIKPNKYNSICQRNEIFFYKIPILIDMIIY